MQEKVREFEKMLKEELEKEIMLIMDFGDNHYRYLP
jgi:hypothetical protein